MSNTMMNSLWKSMMKGMRNSMLNIMKKSRRKIMRNSRMNIVGYKAPRFAKMACPIELLLKT